MAIKLHDAGWAGRHLGIIATGAEPGRKKLVLEALLYGDGAEVVFPDDAKFEDVAVAGSAHRAEATPILTFMVETGDFFVRQEGGVGAVRGQAAGEYHLRGKVGDEAFELSFHFDPDATIPLRA